MKLFVAGFAVLCSLLTSSVLAQRIQESLTPAPVASAGAPCDDLQFEVIPFTHSEDFSTSIKSLGHTLTDGRAHGMSVLGIGMGLVRAERFAATTVGRSPAGCRIFMTRLGYVQNVLYVGRELRTSPCLFDHVKGHERQHVAMYEQFMSETIPARLPDVVLELTPQLAALDDRSAATAVESRLLAVLREVKPLHDAFDSPEEAQRNFTVCGGGARRMLLVM